MSSVIDSIERRQQRQGLPPIAAGDRVRVHFQVVEGNRRRTQVFEGIVLRRQGSGARETFTVRKQSFGVGVERTFPLHSPKIEKLEIAAVDAEGVTAEEAEAEEVDATTAGPLEEAEEEAAAEGEAGAEEAATDAEAPEAGETEDTAAAQDAEDESPQGDSGDSGEDSV